MIDPVLLDVAPVALEDGQASRRRRADALDALVEALPEGLTSLELRTVAREFLELARQAGPQPEVGELPYRVRLQYQQRFLGTRRAHWVIRQRAIREYDCHACENEIDVADWHWAGQNGERICLDCPNARTAA